MSPLDRACEALKARAGRTEYGPVIPPAIVPDLVRAVLLAVRDLDEASIQAGERSAWDDDNSMPTIRAMPKGFAAIIDHLVSTGEPS